MNMTRFRELLRRDGWLYAAIALCVVLALSVSAISGSSPTRKPALPACCPKSRGRAVSA